jgi:hypothetical protein
MVRSKIAELLQNKKTRLKTLLFLKSAMDAKQEKWVSIFDSLRPGNIVEVWAPSVMGGGTNNFHPFKVGRRSRPKKWNTEKIRLDPVDGPKKPAWASHFLYKRFDRRTGEPRITAAAGDMGLSLKGLRKR